MNKERCSRRWTKEEYEYLENSWGRVSIPTISKNLNRSIEAIKIKAGKLKLGVTLENGNYITFNQLVQAVTGGGVARSYYLKSWVKNRNFPLKTQKVNKCSFRVVDIDEFWKWAEKNRSFIDFSKMQPNILGKEPDWVEEQRRKDFSSNSLQRKDPWTSAEDERLKFLLKQQKYGYAEMSKMLKRSEGAIQRRCTTLGIKDRPVKADNHGSTSVWTSEMYEMLADGIRNGESYSMIAEKIGKSEKAIRGKVYVKYCTEDADKVRAILKDGNWGDNAPHPKVKQALTLSGYRASTPKQLSALVAILKYRLNSLGYEPYWQRYMCVKWNDFKGCTANCDNCDSCTEFERIKPQYCARCGKTFFEREKNRFCSACRIARKKQAQRKWYLMNNKNNNGKAEDNELAKR